MNAHLRLNADVRSSCGQSDENMAFLFVSCTNVREVPANFTTEAMFNLQHFQGAGATHRQSCCQCSWRLGNRKTFSL